MSRRSAESYRAGLSRTTRIEGGFAVGGRDVGIRSESAHLIQRGGSLEVGRKAPFGLDSREFATVTCALGGRLSVPKVSEFYGISIYMYYREHGPPHFHALYGSQEALIAIEDLSVLRGSLSPRALGLVAEWASQHQDELARNWKRARRHEPLDQIEPLA